MTTGWKDFSLKNFIKGFFKQGDAPRVGAKVFHESYGEGIISDTKGFGVTGKVSVDFGYAKPIVPLAELILDSEIEKGNEEENRRFETQERESPVPDSGMHTHSRRSEEIAESDRFKKHGIDSSGYHIPSDPYRSIPTSAENSHESVTIDVHDPTFEAAASKQNRVGLVTESGFAPETSFSRSQDLGKSLHLSEVSEHLKENTEKSVTAGAQDPTFEAAPTPQSPVDLVPDPEIAPTESLPQSQDSGKSLHLAEVSRHLKENIEESVKGGAQDPTLETTLTRQTPVDLLAESEFAPDASLPQSKDSEKYLQLGEVSEQSRKNIEQEVIESRKGIMALRLGQVLESQVLDLSIGTEELERELRRSVSMVVDDQTVFLLLDAAWGAGKTHALTMLQALARQNRMAISSVVMDGVSASFTYPMDLMSEVMSLLRFSDDPISCDLAYQLSKARNQKIMDYLERRGAYFIANTLWSLPPVAFDDNDVMDAICDFLSLKASATHTNKELQKKSIYTKLKTIKASKLADRASRFVALLREWAIFSSAMGCNGLLIVFDELDVEYSHSAQRSSSAYKLRMRRRELLQELSQIKDAPLLVAFAAAPGGFDENEEDDPVLDIRNCFGNRIKHIKIPILEKSDFRQLLHRLLNLYADAYHLDKDAFDEDSIDRVFEEVFYEYQKDSNAVTRRFVRSSIERMDISFLQDRGSETSFSPHK